MNYFLRTHYLNRLTDLTILARMGSDYSSAIGTYATAISPLLPVGWRITLNDSTVG